MVLLLTKLFAVKYGNLNNQIGKIGKKEYPSRTAARSKPVGKTCVFTSYSPLQLFNKLRHWPSIAGMSPQSHCGDEEDGRIGLSS